MSHVLLLASSSTSRQYLLNEAKIPFKLVGQTADEAVCDWTLPLQKLVESIALYKMDNAILPEGTEGEMCFVLTADTLSQDSSGTIQGKPKDAADAVAKIRAAREGTSLLCTAFCLDRRLYSGGKWMLDKRIVKTVHASYVFIVPEACIVDYFQNSIGYKTAGAIAIEQFGLQFLRSVQGSFTSIIGLPLFEVREALSELGFYST